VPLLHLAKSKVGTSNQVKLYKPMNTLTPLENFEQLTKILRERVPREHYRKPSRQRLSTTINSLSNMLGMILQQNQRYVDEREPKKYWYLTKPSQELRFIQLLDDL
jgi:hypothetical protein